jgi:TRAP-type C4-dicarboxylate transport system permease small subunit
LATVRKISERLGRILEHVVAAFFFVILATTLVLVTLRYVFNRGIPGGYELTVYLFIYTTAIGAAISVGRHQHIKIDFFVNKLKGSVRRVVDIVAQVLVAGINAVMIYLGVPWIREVGSFQSPVMRIPNWTIEIAVPIGSALAILFCVLNIVRDLVGDTDLEETTGAASSG